MGNNWEVSDLQIRTSASKSDEDSIFANGIMQVPVIVSIKAVDKTTRDRVTLSDSELSSIRLVDYDDTSKELSDGWSYTTDVKTVFSNTLPAAAKASRLVALDQVQLQADANSGPQSKKYMVSTTKVENKSVAASIKQPDDETITTHSETYNNHVTLKGLSPIKYTLDNVSVVREDTDNGTYAFDWQGALNKSWETAYKNWDQDNYYVSSSTKYKFVKADLHDYDSTGRGGGHPSDDRLKGVYSYHAADKKNLKLSFIWDFGGGSTTKAAGLLKEATVTDWGQQVGRRAHAYPDIKVNQKSNALCLTRLAIDCPDEIWGSNWSNTNCGFTIYDEYGNSGKFSASFSDDHNLIKIKNDS
ncbi:hypothetical protein F5B21DRAFT_478203 [Xylaria acuta]|nr:hypothetical protein F5B21DRAFT_478203 [Xylaria acuta]